MVRTRARSLLAERGIVIAESVFYGRTKIRKFKDGSVRVELREEAT